MLFYRVLHDIMGNVVFCRFNYIKIIFCIKKIKMNIFKINQGESTKRFGVHVLQRNQEINYRAMSGVDLIDDIHQRLLIFESRV